MNILDINNVGTVDACVYHRNHVDFNSFLKVLGWCKRYHKHGAALQSPDELAWRLAEALQDYMRHARLTDGYNSGQVSRNEFFSTSCKIRLVREGIQVIGGYCVLKGELMGVCTSSGGLGDLIMEDAIAHGATHLDCFDGYLVEFYKRHGFVEYKREKNWDGDTHPDVVYMSIEK